MPRTAALVLAASTGLFAGCGGGGKPSDLQFETVKVERAPIVSRISASGTLNALVTVQVGSQVSGRIQSIEVDFNSAVKKGQELARIDPQFYKAAREMAQANKMAAEANLQRSSVQERDAKRQYGRARDLAAQGIATQAELDAAQAAFEAAQAQTESLRGQLEQARAALNQAEINLAYTNIISPINGVVVSRNVDIGQTVAASLQTPTLFLIAEDLRKMQVDTSIAEADVGKLQPGMLAGFTVDAYPNQRFQGKIRQIRNAPTTVQNVVTYDAVIDVDNSELKFKPGMTANVVVVTAQQDDALRVPNAALRFRPPPEALPEGFRGAGGAAGGRGPQATGGPRPGGGMPGGGAPAGRPGVADPGGPGSDRRLVWLLKDKKPVPAPIRIGITDGTYTEVAEGKLQEGDLVIINASTPGAGGNVPPGMRRGL